MTTWLLCVDQVNQSGTYVLNPAHVVYISRRDGYWHATDSLGHYHVISGVDDERVEALSERQEVSGT